MGPVLFFDSGVGGLSIWQSVSMRLPQLEAVYAMDDAGFPYGELANDVLISRVLGMVQAVAERHSLAMIVIACNSASTLALPALRAAFSCPVVGVVPAIKPAAQLSRSGHIGLLATPGTVARDYTRQLHQDFAADKTLLKIGSSELVLMAEAKLRGGVVDMDKLKAILAPWQGSQQPDVVVLGCTHFPLLREEIAQVLGPATKLVDTGEAIARRVDSLLALGPDNKKGGLSHLYHTAAAPQGLACIKRWLRPDAGIAQLTL